MQGGHEAPPLQVTLPTNICRGAPCGYPHHLEHRTNQIDDRLGDRQQLIIEPSADPDLAQI
jgi:hypothetical protein